MDKKAVIINFSRHAYTYDKYANLQRRLARQLLELIKKRDIHKILEIGSGTGNYTLLLKKRFTHAQIKAIDISDKMLEVASGKIKDKNVTFILQDAERINWIEDFDLITSNACFQWFEDLEAALARYKNLLGENGLILFSVFGPRTLCELNTVLKYVCGDVSISAGTFMAKERLQAILDKTFVKAEIKEVVYKQSFLCLHQFLEKIRHTGTNGCAFGTKIFFTPRLLNRLEEAYLKSFGQIRASYQVFFCYGEK